MKKIILSAGFCAILLFSAVIPSKAQNLEFCNSIGRSAKQIMQARQDGISMENIIAGLPEKGATRNFLMDMLVMAYGKPRYHSEEYKQKSVENFENLWYLNCIKIERN